MKYDNTLKERIELLVNNYLKSKDSMTEAEKDAFKDDLVTQLDDYILPYSRKKNIPPDCIADARQQARYGVMEALEGYNPSKGLFMSYVKYHVRNRLNRDRTCSWINVPIYIRDIVSKVNRFEEDCLFSRGGVPDDQEILEELGITPEILKKVRNVQDLSSEEVCEESNGTYEEDHDTKLDVEKALEKLAPEQRKVVYDYFYKQKTAKEISEEIGSSINEVYIILKKAKLVLASLLEEYA